MKIYVLMYDCSQYYGVFSSVEKAVEFIKNQYNKNKITRVERCGHYYEVYIEYTYTNWDTKEEVVYERSTFTIIEEELDGTEFYGRI